MAGWLSRWLLLPMVVAAATTSNRPLTLPPEPPTAQDALRRLEEIEADAVRRSFDTAYIERGRYTEVELQTELGALKVAWLWSEWLEPRKTVSIHLGSGSVEITAEQVRQAVELCGCSPVLVSLGTLGRFSSVLVSNLDAKSAAQGLSVRFWNHAGRAVEMPALRTPMSIRLPTNANASCAHWDAGPVTWSSDAVSTEHTSDALVCRTIHLGIAGAVEERWSLEQQRQQAAAEAIAQLEALEMTNVQETLLRNLSKGSELEMQTALGLLKVVMLPDALSEDLTVNVSQDSVTVKQEHLTRAKALAGGDVILSVLKLDARASGLATDHVLGRRLKTLRAVENGNYLQSDALSINFWTRQPSRVDMQALPTPMVMTLRVENENATCAYWDEERAKWSAEGVTAVPNANPQAITCSTTHLSIFGGVLNLIVRNIAIALKCSTVSGLLTAESLERLAQGLGLGVVAAWINHLFLFCSLICLVLAIFWDLKADETLSRYERELLLLRTADEPREEVQDDDEDEHGCAATCFEGVKSVTEQVLDVMLQASGGATWIEALKEAVTNFQASAVKNSVKVLQTHRVRACAESVEQVAKLRGKDGTLTLSMLNLPLSDAAPCDMEETKRAAHEEATQPVGFAPESDRELSPKNLEDERPATAGSRASRGQELKKVERLYEKVQEEGAGAASQFLGNNYFVRILVLFPAAHPLTKLLRYSLVMPYTIRWGLFVMKVLSCGALSAAFFSSGATDPDSDPECTPPEDFWADLVQSVTVGLITSLLGDVLVLVFYTIQKKKVVERDAWTEDDKEKQRCWWRMKFVIFWIVASLYIGFCQLYCWLFLANVQMADAALWVESVAMSLLQDFMFKPLLLALILATISSLVLLCKPSVRGEITKEWLEDEPSPSPSGAHKAQPTEGVTGDFDAPLPGTPV